MNSLENLENLPKWYASAACIGQDLDLFFEPELYHKAKEICKDCPVKEPCKEYGIENEQFGIWGGLSPEQRRKIRSVRRKYDSTNSS